MSCDSRQFEKTNHWLNARLRYLLCINRAISSADALEIQQSCTKPFICQEFRWRIFLIWYNEQPCFRDVHILNYHTVLLYIDEMCVSVKMVFLWLEYIDISFLYTVRCCYNVVQYNIDGLVQERRNSTASAMELPLSCTKSLTWYCIHHCTDWGRI